MKTTKSILLVLLTIIFAGCNKSGTKTESNKWDKTSPIVYKDTKGNGITLIFYGEPKGPVKVVLQIDKVDRKDKNREDSQGIQEADELAKLKLDSSKVIECRSTESETCLEAELTEEKARPLASACLTSHCPIGQDYLTITKNRESLILEINNSPGDYGIRIKPNEVSLPSDRKDLTNRNLTLTASEFNTALSRIPHNINLKRQ